MEILGNILDFTNLTQENIYVLDSPILSNSQLEKFINFFGKNSITIDCTFDKSENLESAIKKYKENLKLQQDKVLLN